MSSLATSSPVSASTLAYLIRWPVFLLIWLKETFSVSEVAGNRATGQVTSDSCKKPFQFARGAILETPLLRHDLIIQAGCGSIIGIQGRYRRPSPARPRRRRLPPPTKGRPTGSRGRSGAPPCGRRG